MGGHKINTAPGGGRERDMSNAKSCAKGFARLPLEVQAYVKSEIALQMKKATHNLIACDVAIRHRESIAGWIKFFCYIFLAGVWVVGSWLFAPTVIKKMVDARVTIPKIKNAAEDVLERNLTHLASEKMVPFEQRAAALQESLQKTEDNLEKVRHSLSLMADMNLAQTFDRAAYERVKLMSETNSGNDALLCRQVAKSIREKLVNERDPDNFYIKAVVSFTGDEYRGPFTMDEIYCSLRDTNDAERTVNLIRLDKHRCFHGVLLDIATRAESLKTAETALSVLEKLGAPSSSLWYLENVSNWVVSASKKDTQFPSADYDCYLELLRRDGLLAARWASSNLLPKFADMDKTRTLAVVEALSRGDVKGANQLTAGYKNVAGRWKQVGDCYYMSVTGDVVRATSMLLKCNSTFPTVIKVLYSERYWGINHWFDFPRIIKELGLKCK